MKISSIAAAAGLLLSMAGPCFAADGPSGEWYVEDHSAVVRISKCGGGYCGFVARGQAGKDYRNPDPRKRNRSIIGIEVMAGMRPSGPNSWSGSTYNADDGQTYAGKIVLTGPSTLTVEGCASGGAPCGSQNWTRAR